MPPCMNRFRFRLLWLRPLADWRCGTTTRPRRNCASHEGDWRVINRLPIILFMKNLLALCLGSLIVIGLSGPLKAGDNVVLVELFTSQGCSSCPPADRTLAKLTEMEGVLPLSMHVDYWDYLGWKDTFASRQHTQRQFAYRDYMGARVVYTPQMIVQGTRDVPGYRPDKIASAIEAERAEQRQAHISINRDDGMLKARLQPNGAARRCTVWVATFDKKETVAIARGENAGHSLTYHHVVSKLMKVGPWAGASEAEIDLPQPGVGEGVAIWIQDDETGRILTASFFEG